MVATPELAFADDRLAPSERGGVTAVIENDLFGGKGSDRNYTNGLKLDWMTDAGAEPPWARRLADLLPTALGHSDTRFEFELGQSMFTPKDLRREAPDPRDRPYAGLLYASAGMIAFADQQSLDQVQVVVGVVGPASQAGKAQRWYHQLIGATEPQGWRAQIPNQFAWEVRLQRTKRNWRSGSAIGMAIDVSPHYGLTLGGLNTAANAGIGFRAGWNLPVDFGPPRISPSLPGSGYFVTDRSFGWYGFGGLDGRYVARSLVLDERSALGAKVNREPWVADAQVGLALYWHDLRVAYTQVWRTHDFKQQGQALTPFGAVSVTWRQ